MSLIRGTRALCAALGLIALGLTGPAGAEETRMEVQVGGARFEAVSIAVPDGKDTGGAKDQIKVITEALRWDLGASFLFQVLDPRSYIANLDKEGVAAASINFSDWNTVGAKLLVKYSATLAEGKLVVDMRLHDVPSGREQIKETYSGTPDDARRFAHQFVNEVVYFLTGQKGVFTTRIAAVKKTKSGRELVVMEVDGHGARQVTNNGSINLLPAWTHDGRSILFTSYIKHNPNLYVQALSGGRPKLLSGERGLNTGGVMSPDGKRIALTLSRDGNSEIYVMNADGTGLKRLTEEWAIDSSPSWSSDGKQIAFVSSRRGDPHIFIMNADGSNVRRVTFRGNYNQTPEWNPNPNLKLIAFTARDERNQFDIFTVNTENNEIQRLTQDQGNNEEPSWSPDGNHLVFTSTREGKSQIWIMAYDGTHQRRITKAGGYSTPVWSPYPN